MKQKGLSLLSLLIVVVLLGVVAIFGSQMGLGYLTQQTLRGVVKNALSEAKSNDMASTQTVKSAIMNKLSVNTLDIDPGAISVNKGSTGFEVTTDYIKEIKVSNNIKIVMDLSFTEETK